MKVMQCLGYADMKNMCLSECQSTKWKMIENMKHSR